MKTKPAAAAADHTWWYSLPLEVRQFVDWAQRSLPEGTRVEIDMQQAVITLGDFTVQVSGLTVRRSNNVPTPAKRRVR